MAQSDNPKPDDEDKIVDETPKTESDSDADAETAEPVEAAPEGDIEDAEVISETPPEEAVEAAEEDAPDEDATDGDAAEAETDDAAGEEPNEEASDPIEAAEETSEEETTVEEAVAEVESEAEAPVPPPPAAAPARTSRGMGFFGFIIGGIIAGLIGFFLGRYADTFIAGDGPTVADNAAALEEHSSRLNALQESVTAAQTGVDEIAARDVAGDIAAAVAPLASTLESTAQSTSEQFGAIASNVDALGARIGDIEGLDLVAQIDAITADLNTVGERVETLALRPIATGMDVDAFDAALSQFRNDLRGALDQAQAEVEEAREAAAQITEDAFRAEQNALADFRSELQASLDQVQAEVVAAEEKAAEISEKAFAAEEEAQRAELSAKAVTAIGQVTAALESGGGYAGPLADAQSAVAFDVPAVIADNALTGVATLAVLQEEFPEAARSALGNAIRADTGESATDRIASFLRVQAGVRSLAPREGNDPDAVLSRAEAALRMGDITGTLTELDALPETGQAAMSEWRALAETRLAALEAAAALTQQLSQN